MLITLLVNIVKQDIIHLMMELVKNVLQAKSHPFKAPLLVLIANVVVNQMLQTLNVLYVTLDSSLMMVNVKLAQ